MATTKGLMERAYARLERTVTGSMTHEDWVALGELVSVMH
jgi:hypothetical protein